MKRYVVRHDRGGYLDSYYVWDNEMQRRLGDRLTIGVAKKRAADFNRFTELPPAAKQSLIGEVGPEATPDEAKEEMARLIARGFTSGRLDNPDGTTTAWSVSFNTWK